MDVTESRLAGAIEDVRLRMHDSADIGNLASHALARRLMGAILLPGPGDLVDADIPDPEVAAIAAIVAAMDALDGETVLLGTDVHERVIRWAMARYLGPVTSGG